MGPANANEYYGEKPTAVASFTWIHENHTVKIGAEWRKDAHTDNNVRGSQGIFNFTNTETALPTNQTTSGGTAGFPYASFLLGLADSASVNAPQDPQERQIGYGLYAQDNWKMTRKMTLDYGVRWDYQTALSELWNRQDNFSPTTPNPTCRRSPRWIRVSGIRPGTLPVQRLLEGLSLCIPASAGHRLSDRFEDRFSRRLGNLIRREYSVRIHHEPGLSRRGDQPAFLGIALLRDSRGNIRAGAAVSAVGPLYGDPESGRPARARATGDRALLGGSPGGPAGPGEPVEHFAAARTRPELRRRSRVCGQPRVWLPAASLNNLNAITPAHAVGGWDQINQLQPTGAC